MLSCIRSISRRPSTSPNSMAWMVSMAWRSWPTTSIYSQPDGVVSPHASLVRKTSKSENIRVFGEERIALGSDYPFPLGEQSPGEGIERLQLDDVQRARLYHGTALEWLGLPATRFA